MTLEHTTVEAFRLFLEWPYFDTIAVDAPPNEEFKDMCKRVGAQNKVLIDLWILADYVQFPKLQNLIMVILLTQYAKDPRKRRIGGLYSKVDDILINTDSESPLRRFCVDYFVWGIPLNFYLKNPKPTRSKKNHQLFSERGLELPGELLVDMMSVFAQRILDKGGVDPLRSLPNYHVPFPEN